MAFAYSSGANQAGMSYPFISAYSVHKPDKDPKLARVRGSQTLYGLLDYVGLKKETEALQYSHFEEDWIMPKLQVDANGAGAANSPVTLTLSANSQFTLDPAQVDISPYVTTQTKKFVPVQVGNIVLIKPFNSTGAADTYVEGIVTVVTPSAGTFVVRPTQQGENIPAVAQDDEIIIVSNAYGEGTGQPLSLSSKVFEIFNQLQIFKMRFTITGTEKSQKIWIEEKFKSGKVTKIGYGLKGEEDTWKRFENYKELGLLLGKNLTGVATANSFPLEQQVSKTKGLIPFILDGGNLVSYNGVPGITLDDFESLLIILDKQRGSKDNLLPCGINLSIQIDRILGDRVQNGGWVYGNTSFDEEKSLSMKFSNFKIGEYTFRKKTYDSFNDLQTLGAKGYGFPHEGMVIPMDNRMVNGESVPSLRLRYLADRELRVSAKDMFEIDGTDQFHVDYLGHCGFEGFGSNRFAYIKRN